MSDCLIHSLTCNGQLDRQNYHRVIDRPINASVHRLILDSIHWTNWKYMQSYKIYPSDSSRNHFIRKFIGLTPRLSRFALSAGMVARYLCRTTRMYMDNRFWLIVISVHESIDWLISRLIYWWIDSQVPETTTNQCSIRARTLSLEQFKNPS